MTGCSAGSQEHNAGTRSQLQALRCAQSRTEYVLHASAHSSYLEQQSIDHDQVTHSQVPLRHTLHTASRHCRSGEKAAGVHKLGKL